MCIRDRLGVDRLFIDEAHNYKNLFLYTKMRNVAGLSTSDAQKSSDMFAKCRYMDELTGNRGVIFATGTPVSNSMTELYTMQRYLQYDRLQELNMTHFDCWASRFGETVTALELAPEGTGYRARTRFSKFFNLPELMNLFKEVADIKTADQLNLPTPEVEYHNIVAQPTEHQKEMVQVLSERASRVHSGSVDPSEDNMLKITGDGRKLGLDQRIINQLLPDEPGTKVNQCVDNIMQIWRDGEADKLTQLVFCDISTPQAAPSKKAAKQLDNPTLHALEQAVPLDEPEPAFTIYEDIRQKLCLLYTSNTCPAMCGASCVRHSGQHSRTLPLQSMWRLLPLPSPKTWMRRRLRCAWALPGSTKSTSSSLCTRPSTPRFTSSAASRSTIPPLPLNGRSRGNLPYPTTMWQPTPPTEPAVPMPTRFWRTA